MWCQKADQWAERATEQAAPLPFAEDEVKTPEQVEDEGVVIDSEGEATCMACLEPIETRWDDEREQWIALEAYRDPEDGQLYHRRCVFATTDETASGANEANSSLKRVREDDVGENERATKRHHTEPL